MTRTLIDIPQQAITQLDALAHSLHMSRAALIRRAIAALLSQQTKVQEKDAFGILKGKIDDGLEYQRKIRGEW